MDNNFTRVPPQALHNQNIPPQQYPPQQYPPQLFPPQQVPSQQVPPQQVPPNFPPQEMNRPAPQTPPRDTARELEEFRETYPELYAMIRYDSKCIPAPVWELISGQNMTLTRAFRVWLDQQQIQNQRNTQRSAGSMRSAGGNAAVSDPFLRGFHAND